MNEPASKPEWHYLPYRAVDHVAPGSALVLAPHPDDEIFGCAGAILAHRARGEAVQTIVLTDGAAGEVPAAVRQAESEAAAAVLGCPPPRFWGLADRSLRYDEALVERLLAALAEHRPAVLYAPSLQEVHPDHRALARAACEAVRRDQQCVLASYEVGMPQTPNRLLDLTPWIEHKAAAMRCFASQLQGQAYDDQIAGLNRFRSYTLGPDVRAAEAYRVWDAAALRADPLLPLFADACLADGRAGAGPPASVPRISVLVRSSGRASLAETLGAIALQTWPHVEVVLVNAAGPAHPPPPAQCGRFPVRWVGELAVASRPVAANAALEAATGQWLLFLDDDDLIEPDHLARLMALVQANPPPPEGPAAYYSGTRVDTPDGASRVLHEPFDPVRLRHENYLPIHAVLFSRTLLGAGCRFDPAFDHYEDWDFWLQCAQHTAFVRGEHVTAIYRSAGGSGAGLLTAQAERARAGRAQLLEKWRRQWSGAELLAVFEQLQAGRHPSRLGRLAARLRRLGRGRRGG